MNHAGNQRETSPRFTPTQQELYDEAHRFGVQIEIPALDALGMLKAKDADRRAVDRVLVREERAEQMRHAA